MTAVNNVIFNGATLVDLTDDTVGAASLLSGYTAHAADGTVVTGTLLAPDATAPILIPDTLEDSSDNGFEDSSGSVIQGCTVYARQ